MTLQQSVKSLSSLRLTVILFALAMFLILAGTLAQVNDGIWTVVHRYFRTPFVWIELQIFVPEKILRLPGSIPFPGGMTLGIVLFINLIAAHAARFKLSAKRAGIIIAHLGVILLLVGEFVTGAAAEEGNMAIDAGSSSNFVEDIRSCELAVIDGSDAKGDLVVVVPQKTLASARAPITHGLLPFDISIVEWMPNSRLLGPMQASAMQRAKADSGIGTQVAATQAAPGNGVEEGSADQPAAYISLKRGDKKLGTYLVAIALEEAQPVMVDGKEYDIQLRFKRTYKPYRLDLIEFRHDVFPGTDKPRNFSSQVRLVDPSRNVDRQVLIYMNHPLRHGGETFYQAAFKQGDVGTILQVVRNPGWLIPYISCGMVTVGLLLHFGMRLATSVRRQTK